MQNELASSPSFSQEISGGDMSGNSGQNKTLFVIIGLLVLVAVGVLVLKLKSSKTDNTLTPTPTPSQMVTLTPTSTPIVSLTPSVSVAPTLSPKQKINIQVLNGTGAKGDAAFLKTKLTNEGYGTITVGNADNASADAQTQVTFYNTFPQNSRIDFVTFLQTLYTTVTSQISTDSASFDAIVVTGVKK